MAGIAGIGELQAAPSVGASGIGQLQAVPGLPSLTPAASSEPSWGLNPFTDWQHATSSLGNWINQNTSVGGLNLGLGSVVNTVANIVPGIANLGYQAGKDIVTGNGSGLVGLGQGVGQGLYHGALDTATDLATAGGLAPWTQATENALGNLPGSYTPTSLRQYATHTGTGLLGGALNDALNLLPVADGAAAVAKVGDVGAAAADAAQAGDLGAKAAVNSGADLEGIQAAKAAATATSVTDAAEKLGVDPARIEQRLALLDSIDKAKTLVNAITNPYSPVIKQLGRAANLPEEGSITAPVTEPSLTPLEQTAQEASSAETEKAVAQQAQIKASGPTQTLYRGENLSGAIPEAEGSGYWYTDNPEVAKEYAGPDGKVQKVDVPDFIAEATQSHNVLDENGDPVAKAYNLERVPHYDELARNLPPDVGETGQVGEGSTSQGIPATEQVPAAMRSYLENSTPVPKWAKSVIGHLPAPMVKLLQWSDNMRVAHEYTKITRESNVALGVVARTVENRPEIQALIEKAQTLMEDRIPGVTPSIASDIIGERVKAALVLGPLWEELEQMRPELDASHPGLVDSILSFHHDLPPADNTPEFRAEINGIAQPISAMRQEEEAKLRGSVFHGERGLPTQEGPTLTKAEQGLAARAQKLTQQAIETEGAARQAEAGPMREALTEASTALKEKAETISQRIGDSIDKATVGRLGKSGLQKWQPLTDAADRLVKAAEQYPDVEALLDPLPKTFGDAMDYATDHGFDPAFMPDMTPARVRELVNGTARLGGEPGKEFVSSTRKMRTGALRRMSLDDQSVEAIIGGLVHATQETRTNMVVDWIDRAVSRPVGPNGEMPQPEGWTAWDPVRRGLISTENVAGEEQAIPGVTRAIPSAVARAIQEYSSTASSPIARAFQLATDPWRFFMLTLNPSFYLHHIVGHMILASVQEGGFHLSDWSNAYKAARDKFMDLPEVTGQNITQAELHTPGVVTYPDFRTALAQGGKREAANYVTQMSHRVIAVSDSFARAVDYFARKREGYTDMEALQHANTALVDYGNLSNNEKTFVRSVIPFYGFQKGILKIAMKMPADHPLVTNLLMQIGKWQTAQSVDANGNPLPSGYQGDVNLGPLGIRNLKNMSPFKDLGALTTPAGLVSNFEYGIIATIRSGLNAPAPFTKAGTQVNQYGQVVPKVTLLSQLGAALASSPQSQVLNGLQGNTSKGPLASALGFVGLPGATQTTLDNAGARNVLSQGEVANSNAAQQAQETAFPVDTLSAQELLAQQASAPGGPLVPTTLGGQQVTQAQITAALQAAQAKQAQSAAATKAAGVNKLGVVRKKSVSRRRTGGSSHKVRARIHKASGHKVSGASHVHKARVSAGTKSKLRQSFGKSFNHGGKIGAQKGGGTGGGLGLKTSLRGVAGLSKKKFK